MFSIIVSVVQVKNSKVARASIPKANCVKRTGKRIARNSTTPPNDSSGCANVVTCEVVKEKKINLASVISFFSLHNCRTTYFENFLSCSPHKDRQLQKKLCQLKRIHPIIKRKNIIRVQWLSQRLVPFPKPSIKLLVTAMPRYPLSRKPRRQPPLLHQSRNLNLLNLGQLLNQHPRLCLKSLQIICRVQKSCLPRKAMPNLFR